MKVYKFSIQVRVDKVKILFLFLHIYIYIYTIYYVNKNYFNAVIAINHLSALIEIDDR